MTSSENNRSANWARLAEGVTYALEIHAEQLRKGSSVPYVSHLLGVAGLVLEHGGDEEQAIAAMLHDAIEDQGAYLEPLIRERFGGRVADIVRGCTDADTVPKPPWQDRKEAYLRHLEDAGADTLLVSCADKVHNVRTICTDIRMHGASDVFARFKGSRVGTLWYYRSLADVFGRLLPGSLSDELTETVARLEQLASSASLPH